LCAATKLLQIAADPNWYKAQRTMQWLPPLIVCPLSINFNL